MKLGIFKSVKDYHEEYAASCDDLGVEYEIIDGLGPDWLKEAEKANVDGFLVRPPGEYPELRALYQERLEILHHHLNHPIYPTLGELTLYENKRYLSDWLKVYHYPHPETKVFGRADDALQYIKKCSMPLVFKSNVGSAGLGVKIIKSRFQAKQMVRRAFGRIHPALTKGIIPKKNRVIPLRGLSQKHYLIIQEFKKIKWEWRIIRIGDSFFGFQKLLKKQMASGSGLKGWVKPPTELLELVREITDRHGFRSMAVDIFETTEDTFLINEMQSLFGSFDISQMYINEKPGRFLYKDGTYHFEEGFFNDYRSYKLRVEDFISLLKADK